MVAPLYAFPFCSPQGPLQAQLRKKRLAAIFCFSHLCLQVNLRRGIKNKRYRFLDTFMLRSLAEREGFEPPEPRSSTVFKTAAIDHSATSPKDKSIAFFLNHQIFCKLFLIFFHGCFATSCSSAKCRDNFFAIFLSPNNLKWRFLQFYPNFGV